MLPNADSNIGGAQPVKCVSNYTLMGHAVMEAWQIIQIGIGLIDLNIQKLQEVDFWASPYFQATPWMCFVAHGIKFYKFWGMISNAQSKLITTTSSLK